MSKEQRPIAIDEKYEVRDNQFWYNDCSFRNLIENKAAIVVNIEGLGIRTLEHTKTPLSYHISPNDQMWWREHKYRHIRVELLEIKEKFESIKEVSHSPICIERENEFYQGYIRFKISVTNRNPYVINDITLDFIFDDNILYISKYDNCTVKNNKFILGNIYGGKSKSITIYFEPLTCSKATDIKCQVTYADHEGNMNSMFMKPKEISIVCPILETEQNINIGRLKEFIEKLPCKDSRVYHVQSGFDVKKLYNLLREVIERRDVKHISTLHSRDEKNYEVWYYGKTKVKEYDIVIKVAILAEQQVLELFASTRSAEALTGLLAEMGRDLKQSVESNITGKNNVINVHIKDSVVQHCNLLDRCDTNGTCDIDVVIENSVIQDTTINDINKSETNITKEEVERKSAEENFYTQENKKVSYESTYMPKNEDISKKSQKNRMSVLIPLLIILGVMGFGILPMLLTDDELTAADDQNGIVGSSYTYNNLSELVEKGDTVTVNYIGRYENGTVFDTSLPDIAKEAGLYNADSTRTYESLSFVVGAGQMISGFDKGVLNMTVGEEKTLKLSPEEAYGEYNQEYLIPVPRSDLENASIVPEIGKQVETMMGFAKIVHITDSTVILDFNSPLAGKNLIFTVTIISIEKNSK